MKFIYEIRGLRNCNPGNLKRTKDDWKGLLKMKDDPVFFQFVSPEYGIRAISKTLNTYYDKHKLDTINKIISRWAPSIENDTKSYINFVTWHVFTHEILNELHVKCKGEELSTFGLSPKNFDLIKTRLIKAIICQENGCQPYSDELIEGSIIF